jgi:hypothetical protein
LFLVCEEVEERNEDRILPREWILQNERVPVHRSAPRFTFA